MIKFEFTLSEADATNLFDCINDRIARANMNAMDAYVAHDTALHKAYRRDADYLTELKSKLTNTRVKEAT